jgi:hypothetical protein
MVTLITTSGFLFGYDYGMNQELFLRGGKAMKLRGFCTSLAIVVLMLICGNAYALDDEHSRNSLRGLKGIYVLIEPLREEIVKDGLTMDDIRADVEDKLRLAGIPVLSKEESLKEPGRAYLYIQETVSKPVGKVYVYNINVELNQEIYLVRSPGVLCIGATWSTGGTGIAVTLRYIRDAIKKYIDEFSTAYLSVNPKK